MHALATDPDKLLAKINSKDGFEFIMTMTNMKKAPTITSGLEGGKIDPYLEADAKKRGYAIYTKNASGQPKLYKDYSPQNDAFSKNPEFNYLYKVTANGMKYIDKNPKASAVQEAMTQGLAVKLVNSAVVTENMQDYKNYRDKTKKAVVDHMVANLEEDPEMIRDFGTPIFKNGKYQGNDSKRLREELENMFTYSGNLNPNYKPKTNYQLSTEKERYAINQYNYLQGQGKSVLGAQDFNPNVREDVAYLRPGVQTSIGTPLYASTSSDFKQVAFSDKDVSDKLSNKFATEYANSIRAIYKDQAMTKEGTPTDVTSNIPVPGYEKVNDGSGVGMLALTSTVNL
jgi:hypothetical protein